MNTPTRHLFTKTKSFSIHTIDTRLAATPRLKRHFPFCHGLIERDKHRARRLLYSSMSFFILHIQRFVSMELTS
jgi:hypothetical protein